MKVSTTFYKSIKHIRQTAMSLFDKGRAMGMSNEAIAEALSPTHDALEKVMIHAVENDIAGCIIAIRALEEEAKSYNALAAEWGEKAADSLHHANEIRSRILGRMAKNGEQIIDDRGFTASAVGNKLIIR